jgi:putative adenylate-forming enzyme
MNLAFVTGVVRQRRSLRRHERWLRARIDEHQAAELATLRRFALERSPFYRRFHAGYESRPLAELPVLSKGQLMESFDELITERDVRLADLREFLASIEGYELFRDRFWVARTSGSTGNPGIFLWNRAEWTTVIASYARAQEWAGIEAGLLRRTRIGVVSSRTPWHQSALVGMSVDSPMFPVRRFDATAPLAETVARLNDWQPENLICYASMGRALAEEQIGGRLRIRPRAVMCSSELLTEESRRRIHQAFGAEPFDVYAATEPAGIAAECERHNKHLFEDLLIVEIVDDRNRPVPPGEVGAKLLVTVLFSRTQPLIRYEMSDRLSPSAAACPCGRTFNLVGSVEGRAEDLLTLPRAGGGTISIHPNVFHRVLEPLPIKQWQVQQTADGIDVRIVRGVDPIDPSHVAASIARELVAAGAAPIQVRAQAVDKVVQTALGKAPLVIGMR